MKILAALVTLAFFYSARHMLVEANDSLENPSMEAGRSELNYKDELKLSDKGKPDNRIAVEKKKLLEFSGLQNQFTPVDARDSSGHNAIYYSVTKDDRNTTEFLLELGADIRQIYDSDSKTLLHVAVINNSTAVLQLLLDDGIPVDVVSSSDETALTIAIKNNSQEACELLLQYKADVKKLTDKGKTYGQIAVLNKALEAARCLRDHGYTEGSVDDIDSSGHTAMYDAVKKDDTDTMEVLAELGADVRQMYGSYTLLHVAAKYGSIRAARFLIDRGLYVNALTGYNWTPLHYTAWKGYLSLAKLLVQHGACINCRSKGGWTPLTAAITYHNADMVDYLRSKGGVE